MSLSYSTFTHVIPNFIRVLAALSVCALTSGCGIAGSGVLVEKEFEFDAYDSIVLINGFEGEVVMGDEFSLRILADDNVIDFVRTEYRDGELLVEFEKNNYRNVTLKAEFTLPRLARVGAIDGTTLDARRVETEGQLEILARDGSTVFLSLPDEVSLTDLNVTANDGSTARFEGKSGQSTVDVHDGSTVSLKGSGTHMTASVRDGSSLLAEDFSVEEFSGRISDGSSADVRATERASGSLKDGSSLNLWGDPRTDIDVSDGSKVNSK